MKTQERVFFMDPVKLFQSRLEHITQVGSPPPLFDCCPFLIALSLYFTLLMILRKPRLDIVNAVFKVRPLSDCRFSADTNGASHGILQAQVSRTGKASERSHSAELQVTQREVFIAPVAETDICHPCFFGHKANR